MSLVCRCRSLDLRDDSWNVTWPSLGRLIRPRKAIALTAERAEPPSQESGGHPGLADGSDTANRMRKQFAALSDG